MKNSTFNRDTIKDFLSKDTLTYDFKIAKTGVENIDKIVTRKFDDKSISIYDHIDDILTHCFLTAKTITAGSDEFHNEVHKIFKNILA